MSKIINYREKIYDLKSIKDLKNIKNILRIKVLWLGYLIL